MKYKFEYDHSRLSLSSLQKSGIRTVKYLEEVIEWEYSICIASSGFEYPLYRFIGLTKKCLGLEVAVTFDHRGRFVLLDAIISDRNEFIKHLASKK